jgi:hypothetical protein
MYVQIFIHYLFVKLNKKFEERGMPLENAVKCIGYTDTVLFLTIEKPGIYQHKSIGKLAPDFYPSIQKPERVTNNYSYRQPT